jgi:hypothetical protein
MNLIVGGKGGHLFPCRTYIAHICIVNTTKNYRCKQSVSGTKATVQGTAVGVGESMQRELAASQIGGSDT